MAMVFWPLLAVTLAVAPIDRHRARAWSIDDGLPQTSVTAIAQDRRGWLQLGTFGGLARFDGQRFDVAEPTDGVGWSSVRITAIAVADDDATWLGLQSGHVVRIDANGGDTQLPAEPTLVGTPIWSLLPDGDAVWVGGSGGLARWDDAWTSIDGAGPTRAIAKHRSVVWTGGTDGLAHVEGTHMVRHDAATGEVLALAVHGDEVAMAGERGIAVLDASGDVRVVDTEASHDLVVAPDGTIYAASGSRVRVAGQPGAYEVGSHVRDLFVGRESALWVGTDGHGLVRLVPEDWWLVDLGLGALPIVEAEDGALLVGYGCDPGGIVHVASSGMLAGIAGGCVRALVWQGGDLLIGLEHTVQRRDSDGVLEMVVDVGHDVLVLRPVGDDLWIGTDTGGAFRLRDGELERVDVGDRRVLAIESGVSGEVWFGTQDGLTRIDRGEVTRFSRTDGVPAAEIRTLRIDADGTVFLGSYGGGLGILRGGVFHRLTSAHGLADDVVSAVLDDGRGALWLHGNRGLSRVMRAELEAWIVDPSRTISVRRWATPEGNGGGQPAGIVMRDGSLALPTVEGVVRIDPARLHDPPPPAPVTVLRAEIDGTQLLPDVSNEVAAGPGQVDVEFTAAILRHPDLAVFEYRMIFDGAADPPWSRAGKDRRLRWAGLRPGRHRIELRVRNEAGVYSAVTAIDLVLAAAWHELWSVRITAVLALLGIVGGALMWRARVVRTHTVRLQQEIDQRLAAEAVGRLAGDVAHEFNNLFAAIRGATSLLPAGAESRMLERCSTRGAQLTSRLLSEARRQHRDAHVPVPPALEGVPTDVPTMAANGRATGPLRIVVVDDDTLVLDTLVLLLRRAGHEPRPYSDPRAALDELSKGVACDLLVTDVLMPELTGSELADRVLAVRPGLPILFVSGFLRDVDAAALPGVLLSKPFGAKDVLVAVAAAMQRAAS